MRMDQQVKGQLLIRYQLHRELALQLVLLVKLFIKRVLRLDLHLEQSEEKLELKVLLGEMVMGLLPRWSYTASRILPTSFFPPYFLELTASFVPHHMITDRIEPHMVANQLLPSHMLSPLLPLLY